MYNKEFILENVIKYYKYIKNSNDLKQVNFKEYKLTSGINFGILEENNYENFPSIIINLYLKPSKNLYDISHFITPWRKKYDIDWIFGENIWVNHNIYTLIHNNGCKNNFINIILDRLQNHGIDNVKLNIIGYSYGGCLGLYLAMYLVGKKILNSSLIKCIVIDAPQFCSQELLDMYSNYYFISGSIIPRIFCFIEYGKYKINYKVKEKSFNIIYNHYETIENLIDELSNNQFIN